MLVCNKFGSIVILALESSATLDSDRRSMAGFGSLSVEESLECSI